MDPWLDTTGNYDKCRIWVCSIPADSDSVLKPGSQIICRHITVWKNRGLSDTETVQACPKKEALRTETASHVHSPVKLPQPSGETINPERESVGRMPASCAGRSALAGPAHCWPISGCRRKRTAQFIISFLRPRVCTLIFA